MYNGSIKKLGLGIATTVIGGFILAVLVRECREIRQTRDAVLRMEQHEKDKGNAGK